MTSMLQGFFNERAMRRYGEFIGAMDMVEEAFHSVDKVIEKVDDSGSSEGWTLPTQGELKALRRKAFDALDQVRLKAKKHEGELVSREWKA